MYLENLVTDSEDPQRLGRFWEAVVGGERLTDEAAGFETRLSIEGGPVLDLCFQRVAEPSPGPSRLHVDVSGRGDQTKEVDRLLGLGARPLDVDLHHGRGLVIADPEGNPCCVTKDATDYADTGPVAALTLDVAEPDTARDFWSWLTGWVDLPGSAHRSLRHRSLLGPVLELRPERAAKGALKNRLHLDVRLEAEDDPDAVSSGIAARGGTELHPESGVLPWRLYADPSGNEFCVLPASS